MVTTDCPTIWEDGDVSLKRLEKLDGEKGTRRWFPRIPGSATSVAGTWLAFRMSVRSSCSLLLAAGGSRLLSSSGS